VELISATDKGQTNADFAYVAKLRPAGGKIAPADCVLAIRGTWVNPANQDRNSQTELVDWPMPSCKNKGCKVHSGAKSVWDQIKGGVVDTLKGLQCKSVVVTGHSLGGQLAALAMFSLQDFYGYQVELSYTFEGSTPFNRAATAVFDGGLFPRNISLFRITHTSDNVVVFPRKDGYLQPGSQVWFYGPTALDYIHCGSVAQAPRCGVNGIPRDTLCSMNSNPSWKKCGGSAPYGGPHCTHPVAPANNFCNMAGSNMAGFVGANVFTCHLGNQLHAKAQQPTVPPQIFPVSSPATAAPTTAKPTGPPTTTTVNEFAGPTFDSSMPSCWTQDMAYVPLGMLGKVAVVKPTPRLCQEYCSATPFCEYVSWWTLQDGTGLCHVSGGWAHQMSMYGAMSGPKSCETPTVEENNLARAINMEIVYLQSLSQATSPNPFVRFDERGFWWRAPVPSLSVGSLIAFSASMLIIGASVALLVMRALNLRFGSLRPIRELSSSMHLTAEDGLE